MTDVQREWFEKDYYQALGVSQTATPKEITSAYRKLARQFHPDANPGDDAAEERFKEVSAAYEVVGDPDKRARYDEVRRMGPMAGGFGGFPGGGGAGGAGVGNLGDIFGNLFGRGSPGQAASQGPRRGTDLEADVTLDFHAAVHGATVTVQVTSDVKCGDCEGSGAAPGTSPRTCPECGGRGSVNDEQGLFSFSRPCMTCGGRGQVVDNPCPKCAGRGVVHRPRSIKAKVPPGVSDGKRVRIKGQGGAGANGGPNGDLFVVVRVTPDAVFGRSGNNLTVTVPVTLAEAALGANVEVPLLDGGTVTIVVPEGSESGRKMKVRGRGVKNSKGVGDLVVTIALEVPKSLNDEQRAALEAFAAATPSPRKDGAATI
jgi:molecular chaperone DnaJ